MNTKDGFITQLGKNEVIIVGTNLNGHHNGGAADQAYEHFGLAWGVSEGISGHTYAFPTLGYEMEKLDTIELEAMRDNLFTTANALTSVKFYLTPVGTGIAGFKLEEIEPLFTNLPSNITKVGW